MIESDPRITVEGFNLYLQFFTSGCDNDCGAAATEKIIRPTVCAQQVLESAFLA